MNRSGQVNPSKSISHLFAHDAAAAIGADQIDAGMASYAVRPANVTATASADCCTIDHLVVEHNLDVRQVRTPFQASSEQVLNCSHCMTKGDRVSA